MAFSVHSTGGPIAGLFVPVVAAVAAARTGSWRAGVLVGGLGAGIALLLAFVVLEGGEPADPQTRIRNRLHPRTVRGLLGRPTIAFTTVLGIIDMYVFQSFVSFFPTFLQEYRGFSTADASLAIGVAFGLITVVLPLVGRAADRFPVDASLVVPYLVTAGGFTLLLLGDGATLVWTGVALVGIGLTWTGAIQSRFMRRFEPDERGTGFGLVRTVMVLGGSTGNVLTGVLAGG